MSHILAQRPHWRKYRFVHSSFTPRGQGGAAGPEEGKACSRPAGGGIFLDKLAGCWSKTGPAASGQQPKGECPFRRVFRVLPPVGRENTDDDLCGLDTTLEGGKLPARNGKSFAALSQGLGLLEAESLSRRRALRPLPNVPLEHVPERRNGQGSRVWRKNDEETEEQTYGICGSPALCK